MLDDFGKELDPLLREAHVEVITSLSKTTIWRKTKAGEFPAPVKISARRCAWRKSDIAAWLAQQSSDGHMRADSDDPGTLTVTVPADLATGIRRSALGAGKRPDDFVIDWLRGRQA